MILSLMARLPLVAGGEMLVRGPVATAERLRVSPLMIGVTLVGFGTSAPELVTCIDATLQGIATGNIIGSSIFKVSACSALIVFAVTSWRINLIEGGVLLAGYLGVVSVSLKSAPETTRPRLLFVAVSAG